MSDDPGGGDRKTAHSHPSDTAAEASLRRAASAHDINQMLAVILGRAELLLMREESVPLKDDLEAIVLAAGDAASMVKRLQRGLPSGRPDPGAAPANLTDAVEAVALLIRPRGSGNWTDPTGPAVPGSWILDAAVPRELFTSVPGQVVREVLSNLLVNALEVLPDGGRIGIRADVRQRRILLDVTDNGPGLDKDTAAHIFEPGFSSSGENFRGIGLAGSRQLLKCFDARLSLGPEPERGARFILDLPLAKAPEPEAAEKSNPRREHGDRPAGFPVLVVDDEPGVRDMLTDVLAELGCRVTAFPDAGEALEGFSSGQFGLALVDQTLPGRSGLELAGRLRAMDPSLVIVLISGWGQEAVLATADPAIVDMTATKPLEWVRLSEILDEGSDLHRQRLQAGDE